MALRDFGYFLLFLGIVWLAVIMPFDPLVLQGPLVLPLILIIFGSLFLLNGFINIELFGKILGYLFLVFIILFIRANGFFTIPTIFFNQPALTEHYLNSFVIDNGSTISLGCDACSLKLLSSSDAEVKVLMNHSADSKPVVVREAGYLSVRLEQEQPLGFMAGGYVNCSIPGSAGSVSLSSGAGSILIDLENPENNYSLNVSAGAGSLNLTNFGTIGFADVYLNTGVGSIDVLINDVVGSKTLDLNTGLGSIDFQIKQGLIVQFDLSTGLGSVDNLYTSASASEFNNATNRLIIRAHTGLGSIDVTIID